MRAAYSTWVWVRCGLKDTMATQRSDDLPPPIAIRRKLRQGERSMIVKQVITSAILAACLTSASPANAQWKELLDSLGGGGASGSPGVSALLSNEDVIAGLKRSAWSGRAARRGIPGAHRRLLSERRCSYSGSRKAQNRRVGAASPETGSLRG